MVKTETSSPHRQLESERFQQALALVEGCGDLDEPLPKGLDVAKTLAPLGVDEDSLIAALLADRRCQARLTGEQIEARFGPQVALLVKNVRLLNNFRPCQQPDDAGNPEQAERLRRLVLALVDDVRAVLIKLAYRLVRLRLLSAEQDELRHCIARETLDVFAPLANRLGVAELKWEMEDLAFRYSNPQSYREIGKALELRRVDREAYVDAFRETLKRFLAEAGIEAKVSGRPKHIYSIWRKLRRKGIGLDELFDIHAVRVIVDSVRDCYTVLGIIHTHWRTIPKEFDDYIANPKPNGYQSLHTVIIGPQDKPVEIQIRTAEMHEFAEHGVAAHWRYKEGGGDDTLNEVILSLRRLIDESSGDAELLADFKSTAFPDRVYVLTPAGDVIDLVRGATPLDFAYHIHTQVGHRCRGAKIDGRIAPLTTPLENGQTVEILTGSEPRPSRDWMNPSLGFLASSSARAKVRHWFHAQDREANLEAGQRMVEQMARRFGARPQSVEALMRHFRHESEESLYVAIGRGDIRTSQLEAAFRARSEVSEKRSEASVPPARRATEASVLGVRNLLTRIGKCCQPVPGDDVVGYITQGKGVTIHRRDCANMRALPIERLDRLVEVDWGQADARFPVWLEIIAYDRTGLLSDVTQVFANLKSNVSRVETVTNPQSGQVKMRICASVEDYDQLTALITRIEQLRNIFSVKRSDC